MIKAFYQFFCIALKRDLTHKQYSTNLSVHSG